MHGMSHFHPDSRFVTKVVPSPNSNERGAATPEILLLHYTGMPDMQIALDRLRSREARVSCHYLVCEDGAVLQLVAEADRAWHAGASFWERAGDDLNSRSIGIEIVNPGHEFGYRDFPEPQIAAVIDLAGDIVARRGIRPDRVLGHSDVAPSRKDDPGERFPWGRLAEAGIGLWVPPAPIVPGPALGPGDVGQEVTALQLAFAAYGYGLAPTGVYDAETAQVVIAFQRHFRTARIDGRADLSTQRTLEALIAARDLWVADARSRGSIAR